ncbi:hypothetical protein ABPG74_007090 [Tetrahymena malaccensis]
MYKQQQLRYSNQNTTNNTNHKNGIKEKHAIAEGFIQGQHNQPKNQVSPNHSLPQRQENVYPFQKPNNINNTGNQSPNNNLNVGLQNSANCSPSPSRMSVLINASQKQQCKISYLFCNQANHEMNQLNMACLKPDCQAKGLICCMCLDDHYDHLKHCIAFQKIVSQLKGKIDKNSTFYDESLMSQTSESKDFVNQIELYYKEIRSTIEQFQLQVNQYLEMLKIQYQKQFLENIEKIQSLCSNAGTSLKDFFEKIEINSIIGQSLHTNPSTNLKSDINTFLINVEMGEDMKSIKLKMDSAMSKQSEEIAKQVKHQADRLNQKFQKYMKLLKNHELKFSQTSQTSKSFSGSVRESQISSGSNSQRLNSNKNKRKYQKLIEKESVRKSKGNHLQIPNYGLPISIMNSSETNSQKQNLDNAVLLSTPSSENHLLNNYCLSFQDKKAFLNGQFSSSRGSERKMNEFNLSDYIAQSSQSATQSKKGSVQKQYSALNSRQAFHQQQTFGKPSAQIDISMECEDEDLNSQQHNAYLNQLKRIKPSSRFVVDDEESSKQQSFKPSIQSKQVNNNTNTEDQEEDFEDEDEPYEEDMIGRSDYSYSYDDEEEDDFNDNDYSKNKKLQRYSQGQEEQLQIQQMEMHQSSNGLQNKINNKIQQKGQNNNNNNSISESSKLEYSSSKKPQQINEEIMSFQMPPRNEYSQERMQLDLPFDSNQKGNNIFNGIEKQRNNCSSPNQIQKQNLNLNAESPTFQRNSDSQLSSKIQNKSTYQNDANSNGSIQQTSEYDQNNRSSSPKSKQASTKATSCYNLSPSKSRSHSPNVHVLDNSPTRIMTRSSAKKQSNQDQINNEQNREEQKRNEETENGTLNEEQYYNDQMMYLEQSVQILENQQFSAQKVSQQKEGGGLNSSKQSLQSGSGLNLNSNSGSKSKSRKMKRSQGSRVQEPFDQLKIEHNSQQSSNNPSGQKA